MNNNIKDKLKKRFKNQFDEFIKTDLNDYELTKKSYDYLYPNQEALFISSYMYYSKYSVLDEGVGSLHLNAINREKDIDEKTFNYCFRQITISILVLVIESNKRMHKERSVYEAEKWSTIKKSCSINRRK
ncbi:MAG: hypothetical protein U5K00_12200 [Melioribacteraceae bacterium]|nr:hypothetical protein [Melioribacteraceae bacterium]